MSKPKTFVALLLVLIATVSAFGQKSKTISHARAMEIMKACHEHRFPDCDENPVYDVIVRYRRGDKSLLTPLLKTFEFSDGALAEELDMFYGKELQNNTIQFLTALSRLPAKQGDKICHHIFVEGSQSAMRSLRKRLTRIANNKSSISHVARLSIDAI